MELSVDEAKEKFLAQIGHYNIMFSQIYMVEKDSVNKRDVLRTDLLSKIAASRNVNSPVKEESEDVSQSSDSSDLDDSSDRIKVNRRGISRIS